MRAGTSATALVFILLAGGPANALNGIGASEASNYETGDCQSLRATPGGVDVILACFLASPDGEETCSRVAALGDGGGALGFCEDGNLGGVPPSDIGNPVREGGTQILASSFGGVFRLETPSGNVGTWCQSYPPVATSGSKGGGPKKVELPPPGRKFCVSFNPNSIAGNDETGHPLPVVQDQFVCDEVAARVQTSVRAEAQPLFVALISVALSQEDQPTELVACSVGWERTGAQGARAALDIEDFSVGDTPWLYGNLGSKK